MNWQHELGQEVTLAGRVVGRSEFESGYPTYLVEFERNGKPMREWFKAEELEQEDDD